MSHSSVVFPTPGGPTMVTSRGGGSSGTRSMRGTWRRFSLIWYKRCVSTDSQEHNRAMVLTYIMRSRCLLRKLAGVGEGEGLWILTCKHVSLVELGIVAAIKLTSCRLCLFLLALFRDPMRLVGLAVHLEGPLVSALHCSTKHQNVPARQASNASTATRSSRNFWAADGHDKR